MDFIRGFIWFYGGATEIYWGLGMSRGISIGSSLTYKAVSGRRGVNIHHKGRHRVAKSFYKLFNIFGHVQ